MAAWPASVTSEKDMQIEYAKVSALGDRSDNQGFQERVLNTATALTYLPADEFGAIWARDWENFEPMLRN